MANNSEAIVEDISMPRVYELGYNLLPTVPEADVLAEVKKIKDKITELKGIEIDGEEPLLIDLAYDMIKIIDNKRIRFSQAYFGWIKFDLSPEMMTELKKWLDENSNILRHLLIITVRENTRAPKKYLGRKKEVSKRDDAADMVSELHDPKRVAEETEKKKDEPAQIDENKVDEKIDELVGEE
ncbi:MAG: 30S ribosomal protein S6 [Candidatus Nomurabacteria bacterium]|nr:30S ribosomal protein S6 [Candidatus Nomurabacteria bacterium]